MSTKFKEYKNFDLPRINKEMLERWKAEGTFQQSIESRADAPGFVFYEGPPSANGMPGIHHVIARTIKDIFCRYKTLKGFKVERKAGWDTHGLPVELGVEKMLGITKEDIGSKISVAEYNAKCRTEVMKYTREWEELTEKMGYWVNMDDPYITYDNKYIETLWFLLKKLYEKGFLYKGFSIQPFSPSAGTGLSTHELNQPGCYRDVKDTTCVAQFKVIENNKSAFLFENTNTSVYFLAWTTTPWTLPSNTALAVGANITYVQVRSFNMYTGEPITVILAKDLLSRYFNPEHENLMLEEYETGDKKIPYKILASYTGKQFLGLSYEQLISWVTPESEAFKVITGDFVTTADGTGIVHIAPTFGADDYRVAQQHNIPPVIIYDKQGSIAPLVDKQGRFIPLENIDDNFKSSHVNTQNYKAFAGRYVKNEYDETLDPNAPTADIDIAVMLKKENKAFKIEKHVHNYPHCWRTDKPVLYYPLESWFIKTTAVRERMIELNNTINWKPESTGSGRFGKWLENLVDWNLSRSRYWGTPLPVWRSEDNTEEKCIGSVAELKAEIEKSIAAGNMSNNPLEKFTEGDFSAQNYNSFDLHRPIVDDIILTSENGQKMYRESDLIDVWFDSGAMPYAQVHYPFETTDEALQKQFPANFIAEGVDQTRGWFFTLHALATMLFDKVAFQNIVSNGLVLDKNGNKMSKRLGNAVDPFNTIDTLGSDPLRWYMITNAQPWDNLKFDVNGVDEVKRKFFGTLYNTMSFFTLYANVDGFINAEEQIPVNERPEIDRWIISLLNSLIKEVDENYNNYEPTRAARAIQEFVLDHLSNWYVRLNRKRYWGGQYNKDKIAAYQTLYTCLETVAILASPVAPFYTDQVFRDLNQVSKRFKQNSVHLINFPQYQQQLIDKQLEEQMGIAQQVTSMVLGLRRKVNIKVRQPLGKIMIPATNENFKSNIDAVKPLIMNEVNVKEIEYISDTSDILVKKIKPDFKKLGPKFGKQMKTVSNIVAGFKQTDIAQLEREGSIDIDIEGVKNTLEVTDFDISSEDIPGWLVANEGSITVALDITITNELKHEGVAREFVNRIQNIRKESGFEVTDKIHVEIQAHPEINEAINNFNRYISEQTLANSINLVDRPTNNNAKSIEINEDVSTLISVTKVS